MPKILRTRRSGADYADIHRHISERSVQSADTMLRLFDHYLALLAKSPRMGRPRPELAEGLRSWPINDFILFYRPVTGGIELIRVLHGAMDISLTTWVRLAARSGLHRSADADLNDGLRQG